MIQDCFQPQGNDNLESLDGHSNRSNVVMEDKILLMKQDGSFSCLYPILM